MILSLVDAEPECVKAVAEFGAYDVDLLTSAIMKFQNGARAAFTVGMMLDPGADTRTDRLYLHGTKGYINSDVEYNQSGTLSYTVVSGGEKIVRTVEARQNYALEVEQLGRCIEGQETPHVTEAFSLRNAELMDMILERIGY